MKCIICGRIKTNKDIYDTCGDIACRSMRAKQTNFMNGNHKDTTKTKLVKALQLIFGTNNEHKSNYSKDKHFHHKRKGCKIVYEPILGNRKDTIRKCEFYRCITHDVKICHCGWEIGWHYGNKNKLSNN